MQNIEQTDIQTASPSPVIATETAFRVPRQLPPLKVALFDWDQTISDSNFLYRCTHKATVKELFGDPDFFGADPARYRGQSIQATFIKHYRDTEHAPDWEAKARHAYKRFADNGQQIFNQMLAEGKVKLFEKGKETIEKLVAAGIPVGIVSNAPKEFINDMMLPAMLGPELTAKIAAIGLSYDDKGKPETDTCERMLQTLRQSGAIQGNTDKSSIYFIGDSLTHDMEVAHRMGFTAVLYGVPSLDTYRDLHHKDEPVAPSLHSILHVDDHHQLHTLIDKATASNGLAQQRQI